jgi:Tfp pilus assembly pilus retraction ATPase PilT
MSKTTLKERARRLKTALQDMTGTTVKMSTALELVAREDNFPNWDARSAATRIEGTKILPALHNIVVPRFEQVKPQQSIEAVLLRLPGVVVQIRQALDLNDLNGGLVLLGSTVCQGKTYSMQSVIDDMFAQAPKVRCRVMHLGPMDIAYPENHDVVPRQIEHASFRKLSSEGYRVLVFGEIRCGLSASQALRLAALGYKVIGSMHGVSSENMLERLKALAETVIGSAEIQDLTKQLAKQQRLIVLHQTLASQTGLRVEMTGAGAARISGGGIWDKTSMDKGNGLAGSPFPNNPAVLDGAGQLLTSAGPGLVIVVSPDAEKAMLISSSICQGAVKRATPWVRQADLSRTKSYEEVIKSAMRSDPHFIFVGELNSSARCKAVLDALHTGQNVCGHMVAESASEAMLKFDQYVEHREFPALADGRICFIDPAKFSIK